MKITDIETIPLSNGIPDNDMWYLGGLRAYGRKGNRNHMLIVRVHTDEGITGLGEPCPYAGVDRLIREYEELKPELIGTDPFDVDIISNPRRYGVLPGARSSDITQDRWRGSRTRTYALAGLNMACWDIIGKATGQPVCKLLGGKITDQIPVYASGGINWNYLDEPRILIDEISSYLDKGFDAVKVRVGPDDRFLEALEQLRDDLGWEFELLLEGNMRFDSPGEAAKWGNRYLTLDPAWFEEPLDSRNRAGYQELRAAIPDLPISGGEGHATVDEFRPWILDRAYEIVQPDSNVLGISSAHQVGKLASYEGLSCCVHNWHNAIATAANLHVMAALPNHGMMELGQASYWGCPAFRTEIVQEPIRQHNGVATVPTSPGLGVELDEAALTEYPYEEGPVQVEWEEHPFR